MNREKILAIMDAQIFSFAFITCCLWVAWSLITNGAYAYFYEPDPFILTMETVWFGLLAIHSARRIIEIMDRYRPILRKSQT